MNGRIFRHLDLVFTADRVRAWIYLNNGIIVWTDPNEPSADGYGALANGTSIDSGDKLATLTVNSLNATITFIANPDRPLPRGQRTGIGMKLDCRSNLIGGRINTVEFIVSCPRDPNGAEGDDHSRTERRQGNRGFLRTAVHGISPQFLVPGDRPNGALANCELIPRSRLSSVASEGVSGHLHFHGHPVGYRINLVNHRAAVIG